MKVMRSVVAAAAFAALAGCDAERLLAYARDAGGIAGDAGGNSSDVGGSGSDVGGNPIDAGQFGTPFGTPQLVPGLRAATDDVQDPTLTFESTEIYFTSPSGASSDIWVSRRIVATDPWGPSTLVAELSSPQADADPEISVDGLIMYFASDRDGNGRRLFASRRRTRDTPWETPARVDTLGTSTLDEAPALDRGQIYLVFGSQRGASAYPHLFAATRPDASAAWLVATELTALTSAWHDTDPALFADGRGLLFASRRLTQGRTTDLFQAARSDVNAPFASALAPITELNTTDYTEEDPWVSQDGRHILFTSNRSGHNRIYEAWR